MDSVFMFISTVIVWVMTPGIALFYGGACPTEKCFEYSNV